jgi:hypothetical protein
VWDRYKFLREGLCEAPCTAAVPPGRSNSSLAPVRRRSIKCLLDNEKLVRDALCDDVLVPRPASTSPCNIFSCSRTAFRFGEWSQCSTGCGVGVSTRSIECVDGNGTGCLHTHTHTTALHHACYLLSQMLWYRWRGA